MKNTAFTNKASSLLRNKTKKILALFLMGYFTVISPAAALAQISQPINNVTNTPNTNIVNNTPVSAPVTVPVIVPVPTASPYTTPVPTPSPRPTAIPMPGAPEMVYPQNRQVLDLEGAYMFKVRPVAGANGYLFGLFQNGVMVYENLRDTGRLSPNGEFVVWENNPAHNRFHAGEVQVMVRAWVRNQWTEARTITVTLKPRVKPTAIRSIWNSSGNFGEAVTVYGEGFNATSGKAGNVTFYNQKGQAVAGAPILAWFDNVVKFYVPAVASGQYFVEVQTADGRRSNRIGFTVKAVQPQIHNIWPSTLRIGNYFIITGKNLGTGGKINFYLPRSTAASGSAINYYWSDSFIVGQVPANLRSNQVYGIQVRADASGNRDSALIYRYISR